MSRPNGHIDGSVPAGSGPNGLPQVLQRSASSRNSLQSRFIDLWNSWSFPLTLL